MTVSFVTFGCRLNRAEALDVEAVFIAAGWEVLPPHAKTPPDRIVIRGCSVTEKARRDCEKEIARLARLYPEAEIIRTGCIEGALKTPFVRDTPVPFGTSRAYLKVQDGCSGKCTFCIVPHFRGAPVSVPFDDVVGRARAFLDAGFTELVVTGCNLALYRSQGHDLVSLIVSLAELSETPYRIRLGSLEPSAAISALPSLIAERPDRICPFLHLSLQSGSPRILAAMRRPYTLDAVDAFCTEARTYLGHRLSLGADVITGFPGETEDDFACTRAFLERYAFAHAHVFPFSERPGTPAAEMTPRIPNAIRHARARKLIEDACVRESAYARTFIGGTVIVSTEKSGLSGHTAEGLVCTFDTVNPRRSLVSVHVTDAVGGRLSGAMIRPL